MSESDPVAPLIPWYVAGTLAEDERLAVDRHLPGCAACRALVEQARDQRDLAALGAPEKLLEHVSPRLLTRYSEQPESLDPEVRAWIDSKLSECSTCREAFELLEGVRRELSRPEAQIGTSFAAGVWEWMTATLLRPVPALGYLTAMALMAVWVWQVAPERPGDGPLVLTRIAATGERAIRSEDSPPTTTAIEIPASNRAVLLELQTDLRPSDLEDREMALTLEILDTDGDAVWSEPRSEADFAIRDGRLILPVALNLEGLRVGETHRIVLRVAKPGDPLDGNALFRRSLRVLGD